MRLTGTHLRLVRDYEPYDAENGSVEEDMEDLDVAAKPNDHAEDLPGDGTENGTEHGTGTGQAEEGSQLADGAVEASADEQDEKSEESSEPDIDLASLEALLFGTHHPLTAGRLAELLDLPTTKPIRKAIKRLNQQYADGNRSFRIEQVAGGYQLLTLPHFADQLKKLHQKEADAKLTKAALETLAIIAYKQPILRAEVEAIRGVACGETIRSLMEKHLVKIAGRAEEPGRPILYGTTKRFLELFGLNSLKDLPQPEGQK